jgi:cell division protein FtsX
MDLGGPRGRGWAKRVAVAAAAVIGSLVLVVASGGVRGSGSSSQDQADLFVDFQPGATAEQVEAVERSLRRMKEEVRTVRFVDEGKAYDEMLARVGNKPELVHPADVRASLRVMLRADADPAVVKERLARHDGVDSIFYPNQPR